MDVVRIMDQSPSPTERAGLDWTLTNQALLTRDVAYK